MQVHIEKTKIKPEASSSVGVGHEVIGVMFTAKRKKNGLTTRLKPVNNLSEIKIGHELMVYNHYVSFVKTSAIQKIVKITKYTLTFETETSIYKVKVMR